MSIEIVNGEDITFNLYLKDSFDNPYDLTGTTITAEISATPANISVSGTIIDATSGHISISLTDTQTSTLESGYVDFEILVDNGAHPGGSRKIFQFKKGILAKDRLVS